MDASEQTVEPMEPQPVPFAFGLALWVPVFAVFIWFFLRFLGR